MKYILCILILIIPVYALVVPHNEVKKENIVYVNKEETEKVVKLLDSNEILTLSLEDYVLGVVACEMPASYELEALKAQAVASRTYALEKMSGNNVYDLENSTNNQCYHDINKLKEKWGNNFNKYYNKIKEAINDTSDEYMTYEGNIIKAFYFSTSNGYTENVKDVFGSELDYLVSVDSSWDKNNKNFERTIELSIEEFLNKLGINDNEIKNIDIIERTSSNRIKTIVINNQSFKGTTFRKLLGIRSTDANIEIKDNKVFITTKGYGHGVGLSQYGANEMAKQGHTYDEILKYYYKNIEINSV
jgi:stage II sporulation protein D